jgi:hypothetical protein
LEIKRAYGERKTFIWGRKELANKFKITETQVGRIAKQQKGGWIHL